MTDAPTHQGTQLPGLSADTLACQRGGRRVFDDLSFDLGPGEALILRGPNGSGKSSLLRLLAGFLAPASGEIRWNGESIDRDMAAHRGRLHYVGHLDPVKPSLTAAENLRSNANVMGRALSIEDALKHFDLSRLADLPVRVLSAGQKRRLNLARLAASGRPLWLLDEPTIGLDLNATERLEALLDDHRRADGMAIIATHIGLKVEDAKEIVLEPVKAPTMVAGD